MVWVTFAGGRQVAINGQRGEQRPDGLQHGIEEQQDQRGDNRRFVGPNVSEQASHQTPVVGFP